MIPPVYPPVDSPIYPPVVSPAFTPEQVELYTQSFTFLCVGFAFHLLIHTAILITLIANRRG